ncbi:hypothetical protein ACO0LV_09915 [Pseudactinotalea sp. Z1739]|uniref:hypothetical protein n=1 Tax=Pseudactinotalea sp. Z1739 TaxID=3413028 RepID=UPI003C7AA376
MTGFLAVLAARAVGEPPALRPRHVHRFETAASAPGSQLARPPEEPAPTNLTAAALEAPDRRLVAPLGAPDRRPAADAARQRDVPAPEPPDPTIGEKLVRRTARQAAVQAHDQAARTGPGSGRSAASPAPPEQRTRTTGTGDAAPGATAKPGPRASQSVTGPAPTVPATHGAAAVPQPERTDSPPQELPPHAARARPEDPGAGSDAEAARERTDAAPLPEPPDPAAAPRPHTRYSPAPPAIDVAAILREEVYRALVAQQVLTARERPVVAEPGHARHRPAQGAAVLRADRVSTVPQDGQTGTAGAQAPTVQVSIGRVTVTRAPAAPQPRAAAPARGLVDHAAYLARRRDHR